MASAIAMTITPTIHVSAAVLCSQSTAIVSQSRPVMSVSSRVGRGVNGCGNEGGRAASATDTGSFALAPITLAPETRNSAVQSPVMMKWYGRR